MAVGSAICCRVGYLGQSGNGRRHRPDVRSVEWTAHVRSQICRPRRAQEPALQPGRRGRHGARRRRQRRDLLGRERGPAAAAALSRRGAAGADVSRVPGRSQCAASIPKYMTWARTQSLDAIAAYDFAGPGSQPQRRRSSRAGQGDSRVGWLLRACSGRAPRLGRTFTTDEDRPAARTSRCSATAVAERTSAAIPDRRPHDFAQRRSLPRRRRAGRAISSRSRRLTCYIPLQADPNSDQPGPLPVGRRAPEAGRVDRGGARGDEPARRSVPPRQSEVDVLRTSSRASTGCGTSRCRTCGRRC